MNREMRWRISGFTLIELLIVVAIIAILAVIAVPNFLEAQTRSKVSRAKADQRSMATAVESYAVDNNVAPPGTRSLNSDCKCVGGPSSDANARAQALLTTPIAYITSILNDPFKDKGAVNQNTGTPNPDRLFRYDDMRIPGEHPWGGKNQSYLTCYRMGYTWSFFSVGPQRNLAGTGQETLCGVLSGKGQTNPNLTYWSYDPSNGTMSMGWIVRTNKGVLTVPGS